MRRYTPKWQPGVPALSVGALLAAVTALGAGGVAKGQQASACVPPAAVGEPEGTVVRIATADSERTEFLSGGAYRVTKCDESGRLILTQTVAPIAVPGGGTALVPISVTAPDKEAGRFATTALTYGDPAEPRWAANWLAAAELVKASVISPTPEEETP